MKKNDKAFLELSGFSKTALCRLRALCRVVLPEYETVSKPFFFGEVFP
ncbi:MAG: hypothetical protein J6A75_00425 [Lachnospiraceae bacterium]|nr:hypothetical protein [Lachnospiraceae bacterium]